MMPIISISYSTVLFFILLTGASPEIPSQESEPTEDPSEIAGHILEQIKDHLKGGDQVQGRNFGCTDSFGVFGFLAFLLALLDLILELQSTTPTPPGRRRKDIGGGFIGGRNRNVNCQGNEEMQQAATASYSLLRGFLNALSAQDSDCANRFLCEGAEEAASAGPVGQVVAQVASVNAASWLLKVNSTLFADVASAGNHGALHQECHLQYSDCWDLPTSYRHPGVFKGPHMPPEAYQPILQEVMNTVRKNLVL